MVVVAAVTIVVVVVAAATYCSQTVFKYSASISGTR